MIVFVNPILAVPTWRTTWPANELRRRGYPIGMWGPRFHPEYPIGRGDVVVIHVSNQDVGLIGTVREFRARGTRVWLQFDDDYLSLSDLQDTRGPMVWHMAGRNEPVRTVIAPWHVVLTSDLLQACKESDGVIGATPTCLAAYSRWIGGPSLVIRNWLPRFVTELPIRRAHPPVIGWMGTMEAHARDMEWLSPEVSRLRSFGVVGTWKRVEAMTGRRLDYTRPITEPPQLYKHLGRFTVGLAPLKSDTFNASKSWIKALEYGAMDSPAVCVDHVPYRELKEDGYPVELVSTAHGMVDTANRILDTMPERGGVLREHVRERYTLEGRGGDEWEAWASDVIGMRAVV